VLLSCFSFSDDDDGALVFMLSGFVYSAVLYTSMKNKPRSDKALLGCFLLGISNLFVFYTSAIVMWLPTSIGVFLFYLFPSLSGALLTLLILIKMWKYKIDKKQVYLLLIFIGLASIISSSTLLVVEHFKISATGLVWSVNTIFWWMAFSLGLILNEQSRK
jgi:hypothetical protein